MFFYIFIALNFPKLKTLNLNQFTTRVPNEKLQQFIPTHSQFSTANNFQNYFN